MKSIETRWKIKINALLLVEITLKGSLAHHHDVTLYITTTSPEPYQYCFKFYLYDYTKNRSAEHTSNASQWSGTSFCFHRTRFKVWLSIEQFLLCFWQKIPGAVRSICCYRNRSLEVTSIQKAWEAKISALGSHVFKTLRYRTRTRYNCGLWRKIIP